MKISEIKNEELRVLAKVRAIQHAESRGEAVKDLLCDAFIWDATPERVDFWESVQMGDITEVTPLEIAKDTIETLQSTIKVKDQTIGNYIDLVEVLEGRINSLSEFNNALIGML